MGLRLPIGIDLDISDFIGSIEVKLEAGDVVTLFSDGITEAEDSSEEQYGIDRLCQVISRNHRKNLAGDQGRYHRGRLGARRLQQNP